MKTCLALAVCALALATAASAQLPAGRIVTIDMNRVFAEYYKTPIATDRLKDTAKGFNDQFEELVAQLRKQTEELNKLREDQDKAEYTPEVRDQKKKAVQEKLAETTKTQRDLDEFKRSHQEILQQQQQRMRESIVKEIRDVVTKEAKDAGYLFVFDKSGNTFNMLPAVVYAQESVDITDDILKIMNKNQPKTPPAPAAATPTDDKKSDKKTDEKKPDKK